jgi:quercetin dioxygenase-like cupin family protein
VRTRDVVTVVALLLLPDRALGTRCPPRGRAHDPTRTGTRGARAEPVVIDERWTMNTTRKCAVAAVTSLLVAGAWMSAVGGSATATPTPTLTPAPAVSGLLDDSGRRTLRIAQDGVALTVKDESTVLTTELVYQPGQESGWHSHPGIVIAVVKEGSVVRQTVDRRGRCVSETFEPGDAFYEVGPHFVSNPAAAPALLRITRIYPADMTTPRFEEDAPRCR